MVSFFLSAMGFCAHLFVFFMGMLLMQILKVENGTLLKNLLSKKFVMVENYLQVASADFRAIVRTWVHNKHGFMFDP